jgi:phenylalanyl-tRNA synthetase alpha subunit
MYILFIIILQRYIYFKCGNTVNFIIISRGTWKEKTFKEYNFDALGVMPDCGHLHPLLKVRAEYRQIFLEMG